MVYFVWLVRWCCYFLSDYSEEVKKYMLQCIMTVKKTLDRTPEGRVYEILSLKGYI